jgi:hypothetical protein
MAEKAQGEGSQDVGYGGSDNIS